VFSKIPREIMRQLPPDTLRWLREGWHGYNVVGLFILVFQGALPLLSRVINVTSSEFGVSTKRVLMKTGFISRHSLETLLSKVESISVYQGMLGRLFGSAASSSAAPAARRSSSSASAIPWNSAARCRTNQQSGKSA
jgi:uncharacterized membrane protein YdbT with pleckstrin-like domain